MMYRLLIAASCAALATAGDIKNRMLQDDCPLPQAGLPCPFIILPVRCDGCVYDNTCIAQAAGYELTECSDLVLGNGPSETVAPTFAPSGEQTTMGSAASTADSTAYTSDMEGENTGCPPQTSDGGCGVIFQPVVCGDLNCEYSNQCMAGLHGYSPEDCSEAPSVSASKQSECPAPSSDGACAAIFDPVLCGDNKCEYSSQCLAILAGFPPDDCMRPVEGEGETAVPSEGDATMDLDGVAETMVPSEGNVTTDMDNTDGADDEDAETMAPSEGAVDMEDMDGEEDVETMVPTESETIAATEDEVEVQDGETVIVDVTFIDAEDETETMAPTAGSPDIAPMEGGDGVVDMDEEAEVAQTMAPTVMDEEADVTQTMAPVEEETISLPSTFALTYFSGLPTDVDQDLTTEEYAELVTLLDEFYTTGFQADPAFSDIFVSYTTNIYNQTYTPGGKPHIMFDFDADFAFAEGSNVTEIDLVTKMESLDYTSFIADYLMRNPPLNQLDNVQQVEFSASFVGGGVTLAPETAPAPTPTRPVVTNVPEAPDDIAMMCNPDVLKLTVSDGDFIIQCEKECLEAACCWKENHATVCPDAPQCVEYLVPCGEHLAAVLAELVGAGPEDSTTEAGPEDPPLSDAECSSTSPCSMCQGDCNNDSDCQENLECFRRPGNDDRLVPGCSGNGVPGRDYCYVPADDHLHVRAAQCSPDNPCEACEGDCDTDFDCAGELSCFQTRRGEPSEVPGCMGLVRIGLDFCYNFNYCEDDSDCPDLVACDDEPCDQRVCENNECVLLETRNEGGERKNSYKGGFFQHLRRRLSPQ